MEYATSPNHQLANLVRDARKKLGMTQDQLASALGRSRIWVVRVEKGWRDDRAEPITLDGDIAIKLASVLGVDPLSVLRAGRVAPQEWPDLSNYRSMFDSVRVVDVTSLTLEQQDIIERAINEFKHLNHQHKHP
ncbi:helix-turn-helix transcriptional regulator [Corynebacterium liangguodongii]|nr:helix-turn-helix domain-containing protein [Corynebacterium liangguodongii]